MSDDDTPEDSANETEDPDLNEELDDDELDDDDLEEGELGDDASAEEFEGDKDGGADGDDDDDDDDVATPARPASDDDEDEDEDEVEADLDAILKDRIAAGDDEDDDEEAEQAVKPPVAPGDAEPVQGKQDHEFSCPNCFLLVNSASVVDDECPHCGGPVDIG